mgnify:CR=1 FL=1|tara:strand:+ start:2626 stop:3783 length:1158 start_codon:yes stop_codon:yes gene_type:complete
MIRYAEQEIKDDDIKSVVRVLKSKFLTTGPIIEKFENKISKKFDCKFSVTSNSASSSLILACKALGLKKNDLVWTTPITFVSTANAAIHCGASIDYVDIDKDSYLISPKQLEKKLIQSKRKNKLPKIVIPVHLSGNPCDMKNIYELSKEYKFKIIEDASHAIGSKIDKHKIGSCKYSDITVFSFHPVKVITTGEGGISCTNSKKLYLNMKSNRSHGILREKKDINSQTKYWFYEQKTLGYNFRMNEIQASLGLTQLNKLNRFLEKRHQISKFYYKRFKNLPIKFQLIEKNNISSTHLFIIKIDKKLKTRFFDYMKSKKIGVNFHYMPIFLHKYFKKEKVSEYKKNFPVSFDYYQSAISIPMHTNLTKKNLNYISSTIKKFFIKYT